MYYVLANIVGQGIVLLSSALFTRMMSKADFGLVSTYSTWVLVLNTFICLNLFITVRTAYIDFREEYDAYVSSVLCLNIISGLVITVLIALFSQLFRTGFGIAEVLLACIQSVALNIINYMLAVQAMKNRYKQRSILMVAPNWTHIILSVILMLIFTGNLYLAKISGNAIGLLIFALICATVIFHRAAPTINLKYWKYALRISVPSIFNTLSDLILIQSDRLMLTAMVGSEETAEYTVVYNVSSIIVAIYQAINGAWLPWFFDKIKNKKTEIIREYQGYYVLAFTVFSCGMMTISPELIKIMSPRDYWDSIGYVAPIILASFLIFLYAFFSSYLLYLKKTGRIAINTVIAAVLNVGLNMVLIPKLGARGAVISTVLAYLLLFVLHLLAVLKYGKEYFCFSKMWINTALMVLFGTVFFFTRNWWYVRYATLAVFIVAVYLTRGRKIISKISKR